jgi:hypothetical protein
VGLVRARFSSGPSYPEDCLSLGSAPPRVSIRRLFPRRPRPAPRTPARRWPLLKTVNPGPPDRPRGRPGGELRGPPTRGSRGTPSLVGRRSLAAYREHLAPVRGLDGMKVLLPGNSLDMCGISRGTSSGMRATMRKGRAPEHRTPGSPQPLCEERGDVRKVY